MEGQAEHQERAWNAAVDTLQKFYSIIIAIALTSGLGKFIDLVGAPGTKDLATPIALGMAFVATMFPFYHGMERHLYETHRHKPGAAKPGRPGPLLLDVFVFLIEGSILYAMGRHLADPIPFFHLWTTLLIVDVIWSVVLVWIIQRNNFPRWAINNTVCLVVAWLIWRWVPLMPPFDCASSFASMLPAWTSGVGLDRMLPQHCTLRFDSASTLGIIVVLVEIMRSVFDYTANWSFYFPKPTSRS